MRMCVSAHVRADHSFWRERERMTASETERESKNWKMRETDKREKKMVRRRA